MSVLETIVADLRDLPADRLGEVAAYVKRLKPKTREERLAALMESAGSMTGPEGEEFERAVLEEGKRVSPNDHVW